MGRNVLTESSYKTSRETFGVTRDVHVTAVAEQKAHDTGKLSPLVDPKVDPIRRSLMRFDRVTLANGKKAWIVTIGPPVPVETHMDTTGSMGGNVDTMMTNLPDTYGLLVVVLPGYDVQYAPSIFGDVKDKFIFQRGQFEMTAEKLVEALANMVPERDGADWAEDPHYGLFGSAYLTSAYINRIGLKGYHFLVSDAGAHDRFQMSQLERVFGKDVLERVAENGFANYSAADIAYLSVRDVVQDLLERAHAFYFCIEDRCGNTDYAMSEWLPIYGKERIITLPSTKYLPQAQAAVVGLTEGTLDVQNVVDFLRDTGKMPKTPATDLVRQLRKIPLGAQAELRRKLDRELPKAGDIFLSKGDLWPTLDVEQMVRDKAAEVKNQEKDPQWL